MAIGKMSDIRSMPLGLSPQKDTIPDRGVACVVSEAEPVSTEC